MGFYSDIFCEKRLHKCVNLVSLFLGQLAIKSCKHALVFEFYKMLGSLPPVRPQKYPQIYTCPFNRCLIFNQLRVIAAFLRLSLINVSRGIDKTRTGTYIPPFILKEYYEFKGNTPFRPEKCHEGKKCHLPEYHPAFEF